MPFWHLWTQLGSSPREVAWGSLRAKGMGVFVGLPVDCVWNRGSDLQAGVEIYYWEHPKFWLISGSQNDPLFWDPNFNPPCGQLAAPYPYAHREPGPNSRLYTQIEVLGPAS